MEGMSDDEYQDCIANMGLLEGEEPRLQVACRRSTHGFTPKGLLVFTSDNMIFMQQEGRGSSNYAPALRIGLEHVSGVTVAFASLRIVVGTTGTEEHRFFHFWGKDVREVRSELERVLREARAEKRKLAQVAIAGGTIPRMIFCKFCGARNKSDQTKCSNCGALL